MAKGADNLNEGVESLNGVTNWTTVVRGATVVVLTGLGIIGGSMATYASSDPAASVAKDLSHHVSLDSLRWNQMERRVEALERIAETMSTQVESSNKILEREFGGAR